MPEPRQQDRKLSRNRLATNRDIQEYLSRYKMAQLCNKSNIITAFCSNSFNMILPGEIFATRTGRLTLRQRAVLFGTIFQLVASQACLLQGHSYNEKNNGS